MTTQKLESTITTEMATAKMIRRSSHKPNVGSNLSVTPRPGMLLVKTDQFEYMGLIAIPETSKRPPTTGHIAAVGVGLEDEFENSQRVLFPVYSGTRIKFQNEPDVYRILKADEILAIVNTTEPLEVKIDDGY